MNTVSLVFAVIGFLAVACTAITILLILTISILDVFWASPALRRERARREALARLNPPATVNGTSRTHVGGAA